MFSTSFIHKNPPYQLCQPSMRYAYPIHAISREKNRVDESANDAYLRPLCVCVFLLYMQHELTRIGSDRINNQVCFICLGMLHNCN